MAKSSVCLFLQVLWPIELEGPNILYPSHDTGAFPKTISSPHLCVLSQIILTFITKRSYQRSTKKNKQDGAR